MNNRASIFDFQESLGGKKWNILSTDDDVVRQLCQTHDLPEFVGRLLVQRGVTAETVENFLNPTLKNDFPDPFSMTGMREFSEDIADAIIDGVPVGILADFDVDGATSAAIMTRFLRHVGQEPPVYIPDRLKEGYGPSPEALQSLKDQGAEFVVMLDCGITAFDPIQAGIDIGLKIAVFDHHEPENGLPPATHIINPKREDDESALDMLAACGVTFIACVAINSVLRERCYFKDNNLDEAPLKSWMDLVGLGTVCDMVPLQGINRLFVKTGFEQMAHRNNPGIDALCQVGKIETLPSPKDAGWSLGPRINAGSRVHRSDIGAKLLSTDDAEEALSLAWALEDCNQERKKIQSNMMQVALNKVEFLKGHEEHFILVDDESFHSGLSGLVAGRLKEKYQKPAIVVTYVENEQGVMEGRGSGRSVKGINMAELFQSAREAGVLLKGGGHSMAGGFTIEPDKLDDFRDFISQFIEDLRKKPVVEPIDIAALASIRTAHPEFIKLLMEKVGPFGMGNAEPIFALFDIKVQAVDVLKEKHIRVMMSDNDRGSRMKGMFFGGVGTALGDMLLNNHRTTPFHFVGQFQINSWQGRETVEFHILDGVNVIAASGEGKLKQA
jgi:single-stranded-DNA-specific exonuclease